LCPKEIPILTNIRHGAQNIGQTTPSRTTERGLEYLPMLLLGTSIVLCCALLQGPDQILGQIANDKLCHAAPPDVY